MDDERRRARVLIVDDEPMVRRALSRLVVHFGHHADTAQDGEEALKELVKGFDLVLLDAMLPGIKGFEVVRRMRADERWRTLPVIMLTAHTDRSRRLEAIKAGANDFLGKPVDVVSLQARTDSLLEMKKAQDEVRAQRARLESLVEQRTAELRSALQEVELARDRLQEASYDTIRTLAAAGEYRDECTGAHVERVGRFCGMIAERMGMDAKRGELIEKAAQLHDVGKIGVPDSILLKTGKLTGEERRIMEEHTIIGAKILGDARSEVLRLAKRIALSHHEWWDGGGYPKKRSGEEIPLEGRICAVADVFDALTCRRPYKPAFPNEKAYSILLEESGSHFDPEIVGAFLSEKDRIEEIQERSKKAGGRDACNAELGPKVTNDASVPTRQAS